MPKRTQHRLGSGKDRIAAIINKEIGSRERIALAAELARGVTVPVKDRKGNVVDVRVVKPDLDALKFLEEYATGKPVQRQEIRLDDGFACILVPEQSRAPDLARIAEAKARTKS